MESRTAGRIAWPLAAISMLLVVTSFLIPTPASDP
jgi:hypothetical protein